MSEQPDKPRLNGPNESEAYAFCIMIASGCPPSEAILYFTESRDTAELASMVHRWQSSRAVKAAQVKLMGKPWQELTLDEKIQTGLGQHYASLAYLLFARSYAEVGPADKAKLDTARTTLEAKLAGMAGKTDALTRFFEDWQNMRLRQPIPVKVDVGQA